MLFLRIILLLFLIRELQSLKEAGVIPILLPATTFSLGLSKYAPARKMIDAGLPIALSTDFNPGSCNCDSQQFVTSLACLQMKMLPAEAINAITINAAHSLERGKLIGSLEVGKTGRCYYSGHSDLSIFAISPWKQYSGNVIKKENNKN